MQREMQGILILVGVLQFLGVCNALGECDPLVPEYCGLPLPNSFYMRHDASSRTGLRTNFSTKAFPESIIGKKINPKDWNTFGKQRVIIYHLKADCQKVRT